MKNEKEILLNPGEIQQLLEGGLYWKDIESKLSLENEDSFKRCLNLEDDSETKVITNITQDVKSSEEGKEVRAVLLGEDSIVKDRQINLSHIQEEFSGSYNQQAGTTESSGKGSDYDYKYLDENKYGDKFEHETDEETLFISDLKEETGVRTEDIVFSNEIGFKEEPSLRGWKLVLLMGIVAIITFGFWYYFLSR